MHLHDLEHSKKFCKRTSKPAAAAAAGMAAVPVIGDWRLGGVLEGFLLRAVAGEQQRGKPCDAVQHAMFGGGGQGGGWVVVVVVVVMMLLLL